MGQTDLSLPPPVVAQVISSRQFLVILLQEGELQDSEIGDQTALALRPTVGALARGEEQGSEEDEEYVAGEEEEDDEATLEEEEALAREEGGGGGVGEGDMLAKEADMPLEELLKMYRGGVPGDV